MMIHRSASSRRRRASRSAASSPHRSQTLRRPSVAVGATTPTGSAPSVGDIPAQRPRRASIASINAPTDELSVPREVTVTAADDDMSDYGHESDDNLNEGNLMPDNYNRSPRGSLVLDTSRSPRNSLAPESGQFNRSRNSLVPDNYNRSPRNSLVPDSARGGRNNLAIDYNRSPRASLLPDVENFSRSARNSLVPEADYSRNHRNSLVPEAAGYSRSARNSLVPDISPSRSQRNSLVPDVSRSPRGSLVPETGGARSPRGSIAGDLGCRSPRGSIGPDLGLNRSPRGSIASEVSFNRSPRNSLPLQDGRSPRGSITSTTGGLLDPNRSPRGSIDMNFPGSSRAAASNRSPSPYRMTARTAQGALNSTGDAGGSRRASSSVSQVSADDRKHLCEHTKLNAEMSLGLSAYGSVVYQLNHANMESSGLCDFVCRALGIVYRTVIVTIVLVCLTTLPIVMFIIGIQFVRDCPKEPNIPVYMIVGGSFGTIKMMWMLWRQVKSRRYERLDARDRSSRPPEDMLDTSAGSRITNFLLTSFLIVWFVLGNLWILGIYWPPFEPTLRDPNRWCHKTLYVFSLVHLVVIYSLLGVVGVTIIVMVACQLCICPLLVSCK